MWTPKEIETLKTNHGKLTLPQINQLFDTPKSYTCLRSYAQRLGLFRHKKTGVKLPSKHTFDMHFWDTPNLINVFVGGCVATDGCLFVNRYNTTVFQYKCSVIDECIIDMLIKNLKYSGPKRYHKQAPINKKDGRIYMGKECVSIGIPSGFDNNAQNLEKWLNIPSKQKTFRLGPTNLQDSRLNHAFAIGLVDGDGSLGIVRNKQYNLCYPSINLVSSSQPIIKWFESQMDMICPSLNKNRVAKTAEQKAYNIFRYTICGLRAAVVIDYLRQFPVPKLARKWNNPKMLELINNYKQKHPHLFKIVDLEDLKTLLPDKNNLEFSNPPL